jgi:hypothetical protein
MLNRTSISIQWFALTIKKGNDTITKNVKQIPLLTAEFLQRTKQLPDYNNLEYEHSKRKVSFSY